MATIAEIRRQYPQYKDLSDAQLADALHAKFYRDIPKDDFYRRVGIEGSALRDIGGAVVRGAGQLVSLPGQLAGLVTGDMDNAATRAGQAVEEFGRSLQTPFQRATEEAAAARVAEAERKGGFFSGVGQQLEEFASSPMSVATGVAQTLPAVVGTGGAGLLGRAGARAIIGQAAARAGATAGVAGGTGALVAGDAGQQTYDRVMAMPQETVAASRPYREAIAAGATADEARQAVAISAARRAAAIAAPVAALTAPLGIESAALTGGLRGVVQGAIRGTIGEGAQEFVEEGSQAVAENIGARVADPNVGLLENVGGRATAGAVLGGGMGLAGGAAGGALNKGTVNEEPPVTPPETPSVESGTADSPSPADIPATPASVPSPTPAPSGQNRVVEIDGSPVEVSGLTIDGDGNAVIEDLEGGVRVVPVDSVRVPEPVAVPTPEPAAIQTPEPVAVPTPEPAVVASPEPTPITTADFTAANTPSREFTAAVRGKTLPQVAGYLSENATLPTVRNIMGRAQGVLNALERSGVKFDFAVSDDRSGSMAQRTIKSMRPTVRGVTSMRRARDGGGSIAVGLKSMRAAHPGVQEITASHEIIHAVTLGAISERASLPENSRVRKAADGLTELRNVVGKHYAKIPKDQKPAINTNAFKDADELIAYGLTDKPFQDYLKSIPTPTGNAFTDFIAYIGRVLGLNKGEQNALARLIELTEDLIPVEAAGIADVVSANQTMFRMGDQPGAVQETAAFEPFVGRPAQVSSMRDNFGGPLSRWAPSMFHETSPDTLALFLPTGLVQSDMRYGIFMSDNPDLALGQGRNRGALLQFDASKLRGQLSTAKPGWEFGLSGGSGSEYVASLNRQIDYRDALQAVRIQKGLKFTPVERAVLSRALTAMVNRGWTKNETDSYIEYVRPEPQAESEINLFQEQDGLTLPPETVMQQARRALQNRLARLEQAETLGQLQDRDKSAYEAARRMDSVAAARIEDFNRKYFKPIIEATQAAKISLNELDWFLYARAAEARNRRLQRDSIQRVVDRVEREVGEGLRYRPDESEPSDKQAALNAAVEQAIEEAYDNGEIVVDGSGIPTIEAQEMMRDYMERDEWPVYERIGDLFDKMHRERMELAVRNGLVSRETADYLMAAEPNYAPMKGHASRAGKNQDLSIPDEEFNPVMGYGGTGIAVSLNEWRKAKGRSSLPFSPFGYAQSDAVTSLVRGERNAVGQKFMDFIAANPSNMWRIYSERGLPRNQNGRAISVTNQTPGWLIVKRGGRPFYINVHDPLIERAVKALDVQQMRSALIAAVKFLAAIVKVMARSFTSWNPNFFTVNYARDLESATLNIMSEEDAARGRAAGKDVVSRFARYATQPANARAIAAYEFETDRLNADPALVELYRQFKLDGGSVGWVSREDPKEVAEKVKQDFEDLMMSHRQFGGMQNREGRSKALQYYYRQTARKGRAILGALENTNAVFENGIRFAAYRAGLDAGLSRTQAAMLAREATVDFNMRGEAGELLNSLYMFANAGIQGTARTAKALSNNPIRTKRLTRAQMTVLGAMGAIAAITAYNVAVSAEDDDGELFYDKIDDYKKERAIIIMNPTDGQTYAEIPIPYGFGFFLSGAQKVSDAMRRGEMDKLAPKLVSSLLQNFSPLQFGQGASVTTSVAKAFTPTLLKPFVDLSLNENFMGKPIYNEPFDKNQALSSTPRYNTPEEYKTAARFLNELTGGEGKVKGTLDYPAEGLQYLSEFLLAGAASIGRSIARPVNDGDLKELPIINRFVGGPDKNRNIGPYYERANDAQTRSMEYRNKETAEERQDFLRRNPVAMHPQVQAELKRSRVAIRSINKQRVAVQNNRAMDAAEKRMKLDELNQRINDVYVRFNTVYNRIEKRERG